MSFRHSEKPESEYFSEESLPNDVEILKKEIKQKYLIMLLFISIDYILCFLILLYECHFFQSDKNEIILFIIKIVSISIFYIFITISLLFLIYNLAKVIKYIYIIIALSYYLFEIFMSIKNFIYKTSDREFIDLFFLILLILNIIPRLFVFYYIRKIILEIHEIKDFKKGEEHDIFKERLENKMERKESNWSKSPLTTDKSKSSKDLNGSERKKINELNSLEKIYSINDNYIEDEKEN